MLWLIGVGKSPWEEHADHCIQQNLEHFKRFDLASDYIHQALEAHPSLEGEMLTNPTVHTKTVKYMGRDVQVQTVSFRSPGDYHSPPGKVLLDDCAIFEIRTKRAYGEKHINCRGLLPFHAGFTTTRLWHCSVEGAIRKVENAEKTRSD